MNLKSELEDLLTLFLFGTEKLIVPTFRNLNKSFEDWEYENLIYFQLRRLEHQCLIARSKDGPTEALRLTEQGRRVALRGRDPTGLWRRHWDGKWRFVIFDFPVAEQPRRVKLLRSLRRGGFGYFQHSVWIHPDPAETVRALVNDCADGAEILVLMEAVCCPGYANGELVAASWRFDTLNERYGAYLKIATEEYQALCCSPNPAAQRASWLKREREAWHAAAVEDPFLPEALLPNSYLGQKAWHQRQQVMSAFVGEVTSSR